MSHQSAARVLRRACQRRGHLPKTDGQGKRMCARCLIALDPPPLSVAGEVQSGSCLIAARAVLAALREVAGL